MTDKERVTAVLDAAKTLTADEPGPLNERAVIVSALEWLALREAVQAYARLEEEE